jgi:amino acid transporter
MLGKLKRLLIGDPIPTSGESHHRLPIPVGMAVFASDALSSTAYATEEILIALTGSVFAVQAGLLSLPVALAIALLLAIVVISYRQVIEAYPNGGGTYRVSKARLGTSAGLVAGAALLIDYVLTAAVSVSAGISAVMSTGLITQQLRVPLAIGAIFLIMLVNLRGVKETGKAFILPTYIFIISIFWMIGQGLYQCLFLGQAPGVFYDFTQLSTHGLAALMPSGTAGAGLTDNTMALTMVLVLLKAFSHGCAALTGIEAVSDGAKAFKEPTAKNANRTLLLLGVLLTAMFLGVSFLAYAFHITPLAHETVVSQIAHRVFGNGNVMYFIVQFATLTILTLGANTSFSDFPRLSSFLAQDGFLPRQLINQGDRLVFSNGIIILSMLSMLLIFIYHGDPHDMIPLYSVGVFIAFTLSQSSMVVYHWQERQTGWQKKLVINGLGALATGLVMLLLAIEKFTEGAWIVLVALVLVVIFFRTISNHYKSVGKQLALPVTGYCPIPIEHTVLVLVSSLNRGTIPALEYAKTISDKVEAVHVELKPEATERLRKAWAEWGCGTQLTVLPSPYRSLSEPLIKYIDEVEARYEHDLVTIIVPEFVTKKTWHNLLHNQTALLIKTLLRFKRGKVVTTVRYYLEE